MSLLNVVERSITAGQLISDLERVFTAPGGPPKVVAYAQWPRIDF